MEDQVSKAKGLFVVKWNQKDGDKYSDDGLIRVSSNNPQFGSLMLLQYVYALTDGFMNKRTRIGFITSSVEELEAYVSVNKIVDKFDINDILEVPHKIITIEKLESEVGPKDGYKVKINPSTKEELSFEGEIIVWRTMVVPATDQNTDILISHDKTDRVVSASEDANEILSVKGKE